MHPILLALGVLLAVDAGSATPPPPAKDIPSLQAQLTGIFQKHTVPGASVVVFSSQGTLLELPLGLADKATSRPVESTTPFRFGSVSKLLVALGFLRLEEAGLLSLQDPLSKTVPPGLWSNPYNATHPLLLAHLLEHTSGMDDMHFGELYSPSQQDLPLKTLLARSPGSKIARWEPGSRMAYSNVGYGLAGHALEVAANKPFEDAMDTWVMEPLGLDGASFRSQAARAAAVAVGHSKTSAEPPDAICLRPAGALVASAPELARVGRMLLGWGELDGKRFLAKESIQRMEESHTTGLADAGVPAGYGLGNYTIIKQGELLHGHAGSIDGFGSVVRYSREHGVGVVLVFNSSAADALMGEMLDAVVAWMKTLGAPAPMPAAVVVDPDVLASRQGWYKPVGPRNQFMSFVGTPLGLLHARADGQTLVVEPLQGDATVLVPAGPATMREAVEPVPTWWFTQDAQGKSQLVHHDSFERISAAQAWFIRAQLPGSLVLVLLMAPFLAVWGLVILVLNLRNRSRPRWFARTLFMPILTALALMGLLATLSDRDGHALANVSAANVAMLLLSLCVPTTVVLHVGLLFGEKTAPVAARAVAVLAALAGLVLCSYMLEYGLVGLRMWNH